MGANITAAIEMLEVPDLPCFSHTLQLAVEQGLKLPEVSKITDRCKRLVTHFNHSLKSASETNCIGPQAAFTNQ